MATLTVFAALEQLSASTQIMERLNYEYTRERVLRDNQIVEAIDSGVRSREIQRRTNLSRQQIVNIGNKGPQPVPAAWEDRTL